MMKRLLIAALGLMLAGCGANAAPQPAVTVTQTVGPSLAQPFVYMSDFLAALDDLGIKCPKPEELDASGDTNVRSWVSCPGFHAVLLTIDLSTPTMSAVRSIYAMRAPFVFTDTNWLILTDTEDNARKLGEWIGYQPITP